MESRIMQLEIANTIVIALWLKGLLKDCEKDRIIQRNKEVLFA